ncbi:MAG: sulfatase [Candidatus Krumholzibacteriota bacterium]
MKKSPNFLILHLVLAALFLSGCGGGQEEGSFDLEDVNVLLIVVDTMGAGHVGAWSEGLDTSPNMDALAREGVKFNRAYSPAPWTQPAVASLFTGQTPSRNKVLHLMDTLPDSSFTLARALGERGFRTSGVISHFLINTKQGFGQGFERFNDNAVGGHRAVTSQEVTRNAIMEMRRLKDERFFLFVHYFDPHSEYMHHEEFDQTSGYQGQVHEWSRDIVSLRYNRHKMVDADVDFLRGLYREEISYTDKFIGKLLAQLETLGLKENTLVILTADHGEEFMEHDWIGHTHFLYDTLLHVPMVFSLPGRLQPRVVDEPVSLNDIMPTLMDLSRTPPQDASWDGRSLKELLDGASGKWKRPLFSEVSFLAPDDEKDTPAAEKEAFLAAVSLENWKLIHDLDEDRWMLFDRDADPLEKRDLFNPDHGKVQQMQPLLLEWEKGKVETWGREFKDLQPMSEEERKRLRSLGYVR